MYLHTHLSVTGIHVNDTVVHSRLPHLLNIDIDFFIALLENVKLWDRETESGEFVLISRIYSVLYHKYNASSSHLFLVSLMNATYELKQNSKRKSRAETIKVEL